MEESQLTVRAEGNGSLNTYLCYTLGTKFYFCKSFLKLISFVYIFLYYHGSVFSPYGFCSPFLKPLAKQIAQRQVVVLSSFGELT